MAEDALKSEAEGDNAIVSGAAPGKTLSPAAQRALAEAAARRREAETLQPELGGPSGPEPTRYGDWERKGIISDF